LNPNFILNLIVSVRCCQLLLIRDCTIHLVLPTNTFVGPFAPSAAVA